MYKRPASFVDERQTTRSAMLHNRSRRVALQEEEVEGFQLV